VAVSVGRGSIAAVEHGETVTTETFPGLAPLEGGWSGETFLADAAGERTVVRVYAGRSRGRGPRAAEVDAAVLRLVRGLLPVPEVLEVRRGDEQLDQPALLVTSYLPGTRGDLVVPHLDQDGLRRLGGGVGEVIAALGGMPMLRAGGFEDGDLTIGSLPADGLPGWLEQHAGRFTGWSARDLDALRDLAVEAQARLDTVGRACLVHSDLNPKNLLVDPDTLRITGVLDWEFAHAGHPFTDLGNTLRFEREPVWVDAVLEGSTAIRGEDPGEALDLARCADLWALVELASRVGDNPVADRADGLLRAIAASGDVHAAPPA
jgi:aminoglycoside phosphotransferase (APT) family kinase protein